MIAIFSFAWFHLKLKNIHIHAYAVPSLAKFLSFPVKNDKF